MQRKHLFAGVMILAIIGSFLPWESAFGVTVSGIKGDGVITLILAIIGLVLWFIPWPGGRTSKGSRVTWVFIEALLGALVALIAGYHMGDTFATIGVYLTFFAGFAWVIVLFLPPSMFKDPNKV
jgi:hypothetical protein